MEKKIKESNKPIPSSAQKVLNKDAYIRQIIEVDNNNSKRFICSICTKNQIKGNKQKKKIGDGLNGSKSI